MIKEAKRGVRQRDPPEARGKRKRSDRMRELTLAVAKSKVLQKDTSDSLAIMLGSDKF